MNTPEFLAFLAGPVAAGMGTVNGAGRPSYTRLLGVSGRVGESRLRGICPAVLCDSARADLKENPRAAFTIADITNLKARQFKGRIVSVEDAGEDDDAFVRAYFSTTTPVLSAFFGPGAAGGWSRMLVRPLLALTLDYSDAFDQTPGPVAGRSMDVLTEVG